MVILNLGCGTKTSAAVGVVNIDWSIYLRVKRSLFLRRLAPLVLRGARKLRFDSLSDNILLHDLRRGIPFPRESVDAVFHSHVLEHLDRELVPNFLSEVWRVLKHGGIHRIVVPDLEAVCRAYTTHVELCEASGSAVREHDHLIAALIEQSVRKEAYGTGQQSAPRRVLENVVLGDARRRGETHQWMYDRFNLACLLEQAGYQNPVVRTFNDSDIPGWSEYGLELDEQGSEYKPGSLYIEARK